MAPEPAAESGAPTQGAPGARPGGYEPRPRDTVTDTAANRVGQVVDIIGTVVWLRPVGGGIEWDAHPEDLLPVTAAERLSAGLAVVNARSRGECP